MFNYVVVIRDGAASTQNHGLNALLLVYDDVLVRSGFIVTDS